MPRTDIEFEFDMVFCFGISYAVFSTRIYRQRIARLVESDRPKNIVFVRPSVGSFFCCRAIALQPLGIDLCNFQI